MSSLKSSGGVGMVSCTQSNALASAIWSLARVTFIVPFAFNTAIGCGDGPLLPIPETCKREILSPRTYVIHSQKCFNPPIPVLFQQGSVVVVDRV